LINDTTHYLTIGWGATGANQQHQIIRLYRLSDGQLIDCKAMLPDWDDLVIRYARNENAGLNYDANRQEISYNEFRLNEETQVFR
ncbi:hypothetical protein OFN55_38080, partial [Escherichia coli]|nr:hypothetical protein [Escherichia coli]